MQLQPLAPILLREPPDRAVPEQILLLVSFLLFPLRVFSYLSPFNESMLRTFIILFVTYGHLTICILDSSCWMCKVYPSSLPSFADALFGNQLQIAAIIDFFRGGRLSCFSKRGLL